MTYSQAEIDDFIAAESRYHEGGLTREKAIQFMAQREIHQTFLSRADRDLAYLREALDHYNGHMPYDGMSA